MADGPAAAIERETLVPNKPGRTVLTRDEHEHPFAGLVRIVAKGSKLSRDLSRDEAEAAKRMILMGEAEPVQIGAFLAVLRYRKETAEELAGFVAAARGTIGGGEVQADLDWPSYADRHRQPPYFLLAALLLAANGVHVLMHGIVGEGTASTPRCTRARRGCSVRDGRRSSRARAARRSATR